MLFTGDAEAEEEASILKSGADVKSIVLKAGHHGSKTSSTEEFLRAVSPKAVLFPAAPVIITGIPQGRR